MSSVSDGWRGLTSLVSSSVSPEEQPDTTVRVAQATEAQPKSARRTMGEQVRVVCAKASCLGFMTADYATSAPASGGKTVSGRMCGLIGPQSPCVARGQEVRIGERDPVDSHRGMPAAFRDLISTQLTTSRSDSAPSGTSHGRPSHRSLHSGSGRTSRVRPARTTPNMELRRHATL